MTDKELIQRKLARHFMELLIILQQPRIAELEKFERKKAALARIEARRLRKIARAEREAELEKRKTPLQRLAEEDPKKAFLSIFDRILAA